ncbi:MAG: ABC transporter substrate-binding protein [Alphaproteobacteria bacterium]|nr:ABC transporter substrate-binding protein [Alphaproteobacteria bacterium]
MGLAHRIGRFLVGLCLGAAGIAGSAAAADLRIGVASEATTLDPHFYNLTPNTELHAHIYGALLGRDGDYGLTPDLAASWRAIDATHWEFKLRTGVTFHDGTPFTADDVVFTFERARNVPNSPASYQQFLKSVTKAVAVDAHTLAIETATADPLLLNALQNVPIVSRRHGTGATTADYDIGKAAIGTGPYRMVERVPGDRIVLERYAGFYGAKPDWDRVIVRPIPNSATRTAALLAGDVDLINFVSSSDVEKLKQNQALTVTQSPSARLLYLFPDSDRDASPFVTDAAGKPLARNPMKDVRVRRAMSKAINRQALVERVLEGAAVPGAQFGLDGSYGVSPNLKPEPYDPEGARKLLAEAGYPDGFGITLHAPNDRYPRDAQVAQAVAQMLARIGIRTEVATMSRTIYFGRLAKLEFSLSLIGSNSDSGEPMSLIVYLLHTPVPAQGLGAGNRGRFSDPTLDRILDEAMVTMDEKAREPMLHRAAERGAGELVGVIPMYFPMSTWASRKGVVYPGRADERTVAMEVRPAR